MVFDERERSDSAEEATSQERTEYLDSRHVESFYARASSHVCSVRDGLDFIKHHTLNSNNRQHIPSP